MVSTPAVIQAAGNDDQPDEHAGRALGDRGLHQEAREGDQRGRPHVDERGGGHERRRGRTTSTAMPNAERSSRVRVGRGDDVAIREAEPEEDGEVATDRGAHGGLVARCAASEATGQVGPGLERRVGVGGAAERDRAACSRASAVSTSGKSGLTSRRPRSITAVSWRDRVGVGVVRGAVGSTTSSSIGSPNCTRAEDRSATLSGNVRPTGTMRKPVGSGRPRAERDASGAGLDRIEARPVVRGALGEDGDHVAARRGPGGSHRRRSRCRLVAARVDLPVHEHHPDAPEQPSGERHLLQRPPWRRSGACGPWPR